MPAILPAPDLPPGPRSALVIATGAYADKRLVALRGPAHDAQNLVEVLDDPEIGGFTVKVLRDKPVQTLRVEVDGFLAKRAADETVLVYLSCHGLLDRHRILYFAAQDTDRDLLASTGLEAHWLIERLDGCKARRQVVVLDCCFGGAFALTKSGSEEQDVELDEKFSAKPGRGRVVLTASRATEYSFESEPSADGSVAGSVFTAAMVEGLRTGAADIDGDGLVSTSDLYKFVSKMLLEAGAAQNPQQWLFGVEGELTLARSVAGCIVRPTPIPLQPPLSVRTPTLDEHVSSLLTEAERIATDLSSSRAKVQTLADLAEVVAAIDSGRAAHLADRAEEAAAELTNSLSKPWALAAIVRAVVDIDAKRAARLAAQAESLAPKLLIYGPKSDLLADLAVTMARVDVDRARDIAARIPSSVTKKRALAAIDAAASGDSDGTERISAIIYHDKTARALADIAAARADGDQQRAELLADEAERIAATKLIDDDAQARALAGIALALAGAYPVPAEPRQ